MRRFVASCLSLLKHTDSRYLPHQGHAERERRMMQGVTQQWKHYGKAPRFSIGVDMAAPGADQTVHWGRGAGLPEDKGGV